MSHESGVCPLIHVLMYNTLWLWARGKAEQTCLKRQSFSKLLAFLDSDLLISSLSFPCLLMLWEVDWLMVCCLLGYSLQSNVQNKRYSTHHGQKGRLFLSVTDMVIAPRQYRKVSSHMGLVYKTDDRPMNTALITNTTPTHREFSLCYEENKWMNE